jgi:hypothetical protein
MPEMTGIVRLLGARAPIVAVAKDEAVVGPVELVALTTARTAEPMSPGVSV